MMESMACMVDFRVTGSVESLWFYLYISRQHLEKACEGTLIILFFF
jgi:hypothetical protein